MSLTLKPSSSLTLGGKPAPTAAAPGERGARPKIQRADASAVYPESMAELERIDEQYLAELYAALNAEPRQPYVVLVFQSTAAKNEFLEQMEWGPATVTECVNAGDIAASLNITLPVSAAPKKVMLAKPALTLVSSALTLAQPASVVELDAQDDSADEYAKHKEAARREVQNFADTVETTFWIGIVFTSDAERTRFLAQVATWGEPTEDIYFCGEEVARVLGKTITTPIRKLPDWRPPKRLVALQGPMAE